MLSQAVSHASLEQLPQCAKEHYESVSIKSFKVFITLRQPNNFTFLPAFWGNRILQICREESGKHALPLVIEYL